MEQPSIPNTNPSSKPTKKMKAPTPQELISHYQSQGLEPHEASVKVIEDLQNVLVRVISGSKKEKMMAETSRKLDVVNNRVGVVDMKLESKPGYVETFAIGVASGAALRGIESVWPHVIGGIGNIWSAVTSLTKQPPHS